MVEGLVLSLAALGCLGVGGGMIYLSRRRISQLKQTGASPDAERHWLVVRFFGGGICCIALPLMLVVFDNPSVYS